MKQAETNPILGIFEKMYGESSAERRELAATHFLGSVGDMSTAMGLTGAQREQARWVLGGLASRG